MDTIHEAQIATLPLHAEVHNHGHIRLEEVLGDDLSIINAARVSFAREDEELDESGVGLINYLLRNRHGTPFEHVVFKFNIKAPIFVFREWHRHRIASVNEMSGRYTELKKEFYIPSNEYIRSQVGKPGAYTFETADIDTVLKTLPAITRSCDYAWEAYQYMLEFIVAKEVARLVLPVNIYSQMVWTVNLRSLMNFLSLRNSPHAQAEIRDYAILIEHMVDQAVPHAMEAFREYGRTAP